MKKIISLLLCSALPVGVFADSIQHSPRVNSIMNWEIGGGYIAAAPTRINTITLLDLGIGWNMNMECGRFDPQITVSNQLNGITDGFSNMMGGIITAATGAVAGLPALALQRASPELYDLLQQGILQGKLDFEWAETSCEEMQRVIMGEESFPWEKYKLSAKANNWSQEINASGGDARAAKRAIDATNHGDDGVEWFCSLDRGGAGQPAIRTINDIVIAGYNIMFDRANVCDTAAIGAAAGLGTPLWGYWNNPVRAANWAIAVVGDSQIRTCDGCRKITGQPGKGLTYMLVDTADDVAVILEDIVDGSILLNWTNLNRVSAVPGVMMTDTIIYEIRKRDVATQAEIIAKLSGEIAYARIIEQGRLLTQLLRSGVKEPNIANFEPAKIISDNAIESLNVELEQLDLEIKTRKAIASNTIIKIMGRAEKSIQESDGARRGGTNSTSIYGQP